MQIREEIIGKAIEIAQGILNGSIQPNTGCAMISSLCENNGWPAELTSFSALAHEQYGHEEFGFDSENSIPLIFEECRSLLSGRSNRVAGGL